MIQGAWRAVLGFVAITTVLGILPVAASGFPPLAKDASLAREARIDIAQIVPIVVAPYRWMARKASDGSVVLSGYEPDSETQARLLAAAGAQALDASSIASGAPEGFASDAETALALLALFEEGTADLTGSEWTVTGRVGTAGSADALNDLIDRRKLTAKGWALDIAVPNADSVASESADATGEAGESQQVAEPETDAAIETLPRDSATDGDSIATLAVDEAAVPAFSFAAMKRGDSWLLGGDAPIDAFQRLVDIHLGITSSGRLAVVPGPEGFGVSALKALDVLATLESGRVLFDGRSWTLDGVAASEDIADAAKKVASDEGVDSTISVSASGSSGVEQSEPIEVASSSEPATEAVAPDEPADETPALNVAEPAPAGKEISIEADADDAGPDETLPEPEMADSEIPAVAGAEAKEDDAGADASPPARAEFSELGLSTEPPKPEAPPPPPTVTPFIWQAQLQPDGAMDFSGYVPAEALKRYLDIRSNGGENDTMLANGAPEGFAGAVLAGLNALSELDSGRLDFDGGNWSLTGAAESDATKSRVLAALGPFAENWVVAIATPELPPAPPARPTPPPAVEKGAPDYVFVAEKTSEDGIKLSGDVPAAATRAYLGVIATTSDTDALTVRPDAPGDFIADAVGGLRALMTLDSGKLVYKDFGWSLSGKSASDTTRAAVSAAVGSLPGGMDWSVDVVPPTPFEICMAAVSAFDERNAILFNTGSSRITDDSLPAIDEIAQTLKTCPSAVVHVEGHTDSDGDADSNLILSVSRAEAVVDKLISLGVGESRIYAIGYGESVPIASNDTSDGKRRNRRIVITVSEEAN